MKEKVYVVKRTYLNPLPSYGIRYDTELIKIILGKGEFIDRDLVETNPLYKQIIPYSLLRYNDKIFYYQRSMKGKESRLRAKMSIGVGGHINQLDIATSNGKHTIIDSARDRELLEEFDTHGHKSIKLIGIINDDSDAVGQVHLGLLYELEMFDNIIHSNEPGAYSKYEYASIPYLYSNLNSFESWSSIIIKDYLT
jgi:predicted NUDIX family phosphoesterase